MVVICDNCGFEIDPSIRRCLGCDKDWYKFFETIAKECNREYKEFIESWMKGFCFGEIVVRKGKVVKLMKKIIKNEDIYSLLSQCKTITEFENKSKEIIDGWKRELEDLEKQLRICYECPRLRECILLSQHIYSYVKNI